MHFNRVTPKLRAIFVATLATVSATEGWRPRPTKTRGLTLSPGTHASAIIAIALPAVTPRLVRGVTSGLVISGRARRGLLSTTTPTFFTKVHDGNLA